MRKVWIMRGLPGSGKTTWINKNLPDAEVFSADQFHMVEGTYKYDPKNAGLAHEQCLRNFVLALVVEKKQDCFVIDNTNTSLLELAPYVRVAQALGFEHAIVYLHTSLEVAYVRNTHAVPGTTIMAMQANLLTEKLPAGWNQTIRFGG